MQDVQDDVTAAVGGQQDDVLLGYLDDVSIGVTTADGSAPIGLAVKVGGHFVAVNVFSEVEF